MIVVATWSFIDDDLASASVGTSASAGLLTGPRGMSPKYFSTSGRASRGGDVAGDHQHRIVRAVFVAEPLLDVGQARGVEVLHRADRGVMVGVARRETGCLNSSYWTSPPGRLSPCRFSFWTTPRWLSSTPWVTAPSRWPMRSLSMNSARSSAPVGTVSK